jgi:hypothetical protein
MLPIESFAHNSVCAIVHAEYGHLNKSPTQTAKKLPTTALKYTAHPTSWRNPTRGKDTFRMIHLKDS